VVVLVVAATSGEVKSGFCQRGGVWVVTEAQGRVVEQLVTDCAVALENDFYGDGGATVSGVLYRLVSGIRAARGVPVFDILRHVEMV
jgi:hypothetical protein